MATPSRDIEALQNNFLLHLSEKQGLTSVDDNIFLNNLTLRLTKHGKDVLRQHFQFWEFESPGTSAGNVLRLMRKMMYPYYIDKRVMILFTEQDALICKLAGAYNWVEQ